MFDLEDGEFVLIGLYVDGLHDRHEAADVRGGFGQDDHVGRRVGLDAAVLRDQRFQRVGDRVGVDVAERDQPRHEAVGVRWRQGALCRLDIALLGVSHGNDLQSPARGFDGRKTLDLEDGLEDRVGLLLGDPGGRLDGDLAPHAFVVDEIPVGHLRDRVDDRGDFRVVEVELDEVVPFDRFGSIQFVREPRPRTETQQRDAQQCRCEHSSAPGRRVRTPVHFGPRMGFRSLIEAG